MSASQQAQNKKLHMMIDQLEDQIDRLNCENDHLKGLLREAFQAGMSRMVGSNVYFKQTHPTFDEWAKQKGLV